MRLALWICASLSVAAHAVTVSLLPPLERPVSVQPKPTKPLTTWIAHTKPGSAPTTVQSGEYSTQAANPEIINQATPLPLENTPDSIEATSAIQANHTPTSDPLASPGGDMDGSTQYIPRPQLSLPPVPQTPVIITPPSGVYPIERITGILSLYIDETGKVHHIVSSGTPMPAEFEEAAKQTFMAIPFRPGILDGTPVKSRIRIEVVFDNSPLAEAPVPPKP